jgi:hypothetical protein
LYLHLNLMYPHFILQHQFKFWMYIRLQILTFATKTIMNIFDMLTWDQKWIWHIWQYRGFVLAICGKNHCRFNFHEKLSSYYIELFLPFWGSFCQKYKKISPLNGSIKFFWGFFHLGGSSMRVSKFMKKWIFVYFGKK